MMAMSAESWSTARRRLSCGSKLRALGLWPGGDGETFGGVAVEAAVDDVDGDDAVGGGVADVHEAGVGAKDGAGGGGAQLQ